MRSGTLRACHRGGRRRYLRGAPSWLRTADINLTGDPIGLGIGVACENVAGWPWRLVHPPWSLLQPEGKRDARPGKPANRGRPERRERSSFTCRADFK